MSHSIRKQTVLSTAHLSPPRRSTDRAFHTNSDGERREVFWISLVLWLMVFPVLTSGCTRKEVTSRKMVTEPADYRVTHPADLPPRVSIPLRQHNGYILTPVRINGLDAGLFLVDTGSALNAIAQGVVGRFDLPTGSPGVAHGIGGDEAFTTRWIHTLATGSLVLAEAQPLPVLNLHPLGQSAGHFNGIIGYNNFRQVPFTIDYQRSRLTVWKPGLYRPRSGEQAYRLWPHARLPMVRATVGNGREVWLIVDSGADAQITLPTACASRWPDILAVPVSGRGRSRGVGGTIPSFRSWLTRLRLFGVNLRHVPVNFEQPNAATASRRIVVGRIGHGLLKDFRVTFEASKNRVWAKWLPGEPRLD